MIAAVLQGAFGVVHGAVAGKEQEGAAFAARQHGQDGLNQRVVILWMVRVGQAFGVVKQCLMAEVKGTGEQQGPVVTQAEFARVMREAAVHRQCRREECPTGVAVRNPGGEASGGIHRHRAEGVVTRPDVQPDGAGGGLAGGRFVLRCVVILSDGVFVLKRVVIPLGGVLVLKRVVVPLGGVFILSDRRLREEGGNQFLQILPASVQVGEQLAAHLLRVELALKLGE